MKSPKEDYEIRKPVVSDPGTRKTYSSFSPLFSSLFMNDIYFGEKNSAGAVERAVEI